MSLKGKVNVGATRWIALTGGSGFFLDFFD